MRRSGYTSERAADHDEQLPLLIEWLRERYAARELGATLDEPYRPDVVIENRYYVDLKVPRGPRLAVAAEEFDVQERDYPGTFIFWRRMGVWRWLTIEQLRERQIGERRPPTENGSNTDWYLFDVS